MTHPANTTVGKTKKKRKISLAKSWGQPVDAYATLRKDNKVNVKRGNDKRQLILFNISVISFILIFIPAHNFR